MTWKSIFPAVIFLFFISNKTWCQVQITGTVTDKNNQPIVFATVSLKKHNTIGTLTDGRGDFLLTLSGSQDLTDSLVVSFVGYKRMSIALNSFHINQRQSFILLANETPLSEVVITGQKPIAEEFSVTRVNKLDIYNNPASAGDPLRAITFLPVSTNTGETANPDLRGSSSTRSAVIFNGVPVSNPVRNSQINGIGNFSLFNPEMISKMMIYGSNPPVTYGDASAGLIEIETREKLIENNYQVSSSLANLGFISSIKLKPANFLQVYGNYQFPQAFIGLNKESFEALKDFGTQDTGINIRLRINNKAYVNIYNYFINEHYNAIASSYGVKEEAIGKRRRNFAIVNFNWQTKKNIFFINSGVNVMSSNYVFGNLNAGTREKELYLSINYKRVFNDRISAQGGVSFKGSSVAFQGQEPLYYFALARTSPVKYSDTLLTNLNPELYFYGKWYLKGNLILGAGIRKNVPTSAIQPGFLTYQINMKYDINEKHGVLIAGGQYNNYNIPTGENKNFALLSGRQLALEYKFLSGKNRLQFAGFLKSEDSTMPIYPLNATNSSGIKKGIKGIELYCEKSLLQDFKISLANTFLDVTEQYQNLQWRGSNDMDYFVKVGLIYNNPAIISAGLSFVTRPGTYYSKIISSDYNEKVGAYEPVYSAGFNSDQYSSYSIFNATISKYMTASKVGIIAFCNVVNIFNKLNQRGLDYNQDYSTYTSNYYQKRSIYFGLVFVFQSRRNK